MPTIHEFPDTCAIAATLPTRATLAILENGDTTAVVGTPINRGAISVTETKDNAIIIASTIFTTLPATIARVEPGDVAPITATSQASPPTGPVYMPPATSLVSAEGTWTLSGSNEVRLNGVGTGTFGTPVELLNGTVYVNQGSSWSQWFQDSAVFGTGFGPLTIFGAADPASYVLAPAPAFIGPSNTPDIYSLELTDFATVQGYAQHTINQSVNPHNAEFGIDNNGIRYIRFSNDPAPSTWDRTDGVGSILLTWFLRIGPNMTDARTAGHVRYLVYIEDDVAPAFNTFGVKLPGLINQAGYGPVADDPTRMYLRTFHRFPQSNTFGAADHVEDAEMGAGYPIITDLGIWYKTNRWYCVEQAAILNTIGQTNGYLAYWINGNKVFERNNVNFRTDPNTLFHAYHVNFYHGGLDTPKGLMHYRLAKLAVSSSYIGVPSELLSSSTVPSWRVPMGAVDTVFQIANTANMAGNIPDSGPQIYPTTAGKNALDIDTFSGFAADSHSWWGVSMGGHNGQWSNKVFRVDFRLNQPTYALETIGTQETNYNSVTGGTYVPPADTMDSPTAIDYYNAAPYTGTWTNDGLPCARHTYFANHYIAARNRVFMFYMGSSFGGSSHRSDHVDAYDVNAKLYDAKGTWQDHGLYQGAGANRLVISCAKHPITEDAYGSNNGVWQKWTQTTATWSTITPTNLSYTVWSSQGSMIDGNRNVWISFVSGAMQSINLSTMVCTTTTLTGSGAATFQAEVVPLNFNFAIPIHDLDNDRYLVFTGLMDASEVVIWPGRVFAVSPVTGACTIVINSITPPFNGYMTRLSYFQELGGVAYLPRYSSNILFIPTRVSA